VASIPEHLYNNPTRYEQTKHLWQENNVDIFHSDDLREHFPIRKLISSIASGMIIRKTKSHSAKTSRRTVKTPGFNLTLILLFPKTRLQQKGNQHLCFSLTFIELLYLFKALKMSE